MVGTYGLAIGGGGGIRTCYIAMTYIIQNPDTKVTEMVQIPAFSNTCVKMKFLAKTKHTQLPNRIQTEYCTQSVSYVCHTWIGLMIFGM